MLNRALNQDQVIAVHIDNGFMRKRESQSVEEALKKLGIQVKGIDDPPEKSICEDLLKSYLAYGLSELVVLTKYRFQRMPGCPS